MQPTEPLTGADLRAWRVACGALTQSEAAALLGVKLRSYAGWERDETPSHPRLLALACAAIAEGLPPWRTPADMRPVERPGRGRPPGRRKAVVV